MDKEKACRYCSKFFTPKNPKGKFCSTRHRVAYFRQQRKQQQKQLVQLCQQLPATDQAEIEEFNNFGRLLNGR